MFKKFYKTVLTLKVPNVKGENLDFTTKKSEIQRAQDSFNQKFAGWRKRLIIGKIEKDRIELALIMECDKENITAREIGHFSKCLCNNENWSQYSSEDTKLFKSILFEEISLTELKNLVVDYKDEEFWNELEKFQPTSSNNKIENYKIEDLSDEEALAALKYLMKTKNKNIGATNSQQKIWTINQIKKIILECL